MKSYNKLTGNSSSQTGLLVFIGMLLVFELAIIAFLVVLALRSGGIDNYIAIGFFTVFLVVMGYIYVTLITRRVRRRKLLTDKLLKLSEEEQEYVDNLATEYRGHHLMCNDKYLYGDMSYFVTGSMVGRSAIDFEYLRVDELRLVYVMSSNLPPKLEATLAGAAASTVVGAMYSERVSKYRMVYREINKRPITPRIEQTVHIVLSDGTSYKAKTLPRDFDKIMSTIKTNNPQCRFGTDKEVLEEMLNRPSH